MPGVFEHREGNLLLALTAPRGYPDVANRIEFLIKRAKKSRGRTENQP